MADLQVYTMRIRFDTKYVAYCLRSGGVRTLLLAVLLCCGAARPMCVDENANLTESQIKAGFIFNFLHFVQWPPKAFATSASPITVCIVGESPVTPLLRAAAEGRLVEGRAIAVRYLQPAGQSRACHLVFISAAEARHSARLLERLKRASVLTVGEVEGFSHTSGILNFSTQDNKVKLEINLEAAAHADLKISARLIAAARVVRENSTAGAH